MMLRTLVTTALCLAALPAMAENHALLIGANQYVNLEERWWLKGPANDVQLVAGYLTTTAPVPFDKSNVTVLTDGVAGYDAPTLAAIRTAFATLTARVQPGDFVYLHFSGHGTQAPAANPESELDGLDELFLPVDIGPWSDKTGAVENALVDDEIGLLIDGLRGKGANVWAVFDSCHSGTATRSLDGADEEVRTRQLSPAVLGMDPETMEDVVSRSLGDPRDGVEAPFDAGDATGNFVAFFAAQTNEVTPEKNLPKGKPGRKPQGVFTFTLMEVLAEYPGATYAQIGQEVLRRYSVKNLARSTPLFEGDLDQVVFGGEPGTRVAQWQATVTETGLTIPAGSLHGLATGAVMAVMASAADATDAALGFVTLTRVDTFTATGQPVAKEGKTLPADLVNDLPRGITLRKLDAALDFTLTVALPAPGTAPADALLSALDALADAAGPRLTFVDANAEADLRLAVLPDSPRPDAIWVLPSTGLAEDLGTTPSVLTTDKDGATLAASLADTLTTIARAQNLLKLGAAVGSGGLDVTVELQTRTPQDRTLRALPFAPVPTLLPEDEVHVLARNNTSGPVDVNVLYIAADYSISHWFSGRLQPGDALQKGLFKITDSVLGQERMLVVVTPAKPQSPVEDLSYLAQDALDTTRSLGGSAFNDALAEAGFGATTRGAIALTDEGEDTGPGPVILQLELRTVAGN